VGGRIEYVRMFGVVAVFILLIAAINFMNLATARSGQRAREIGVRKAVGASQRSLVGQFLGESVLMAVLALAVALGMVAAGLPAFNALTDKAITFGRLFPGTVLLFVGLALLTGFLAGVYPALYLSSFNAIAVLRSTFKARRSAVGLRKSLVVFQFAMSILLIVGTLTVYRQIDYIRQKNLGLDRENVVSLTLEGGIQQQYDAFRQELLARPGIASVTATSTNPLDVGQSTTDPTWDGKDPESVVLFHIISARHDFIETMKMEMVAGRSFSRAFATDSVGFIVNEAAARAMGMKDPVGQRLAFWSREGQIIGVVKDFHMTSLYAPIEPTIIRLAPNDTWRLFVRTQAGQTEAALASLEAVYKKFNPAYPFAYEFLDASFEQTYRSEMVIGTLARTFAVLAVFIACMGLFGLASFTAEQRTKEVGIRKVMGASVANLVVLLSRDFIVLVLIAFVLTAPVAYYVAVAWLGNFAYHVALDAQVFAVAGVAALLIAWLTVGYQSVRAAVANPVRALRTE
jgi:putative ABC transport system permease protein